MMHQLCVSVLLLALCMIGKSCWAVSFGMNNCIDPDVYPHLRIEDASVSPHPVELPGDFSVNVDVRVLQPIRGGLTLEVLIYKSVLGIFMKVPCIRDVGSCEYDFCSLLRNRFNRTGVMRCPRPLAEDNFPCACPFSPGRYSVTSGSFSLGEVAGVWRWLAAGDYLVEAKLRDSRTNAVRACLDMNLSLRPAQDECTNWFSCLFRI